MRFSEDFFPIEANAIVSARQTAAGLGRLEEKLLDSDWVLGWRKFLLRFYALKPAPDQLQAWPAALVEYHRSLSPEAGRPPGEVHEVPLRLQAIIERIAAAANGLADLVAGNQVERRDLLDAVMHPAAVAELHLALLTSESDYWSGRAAAAIRAAAERSPTGGWSPSAGDSRAGSDDE